MRSSVTGNPAMTPIVTILVYHFVRPIAGSAWSGLKGMDRQLFERQIGYLRRHHTFIGLADLVAATNGGPPLPEMPAVLTFDDGYVDHYRYAYPALKAAGITGAFFPPSSAVLERRVLDVNKIHFILAVTDDPTRIVKALEAAVEEARGEFTLKSLDEYRRRLWIAGRFDSAEIMYIKLMLQKALPESLRARISSELFHRLVSADEAGFADELYMSTAQLAEMSADGMEIGSHGHAHCWLDSLDADAQAQDIDRSLNMLDAIGLSRTGFFFCYPYGAYNADTLKVLRARQCAAAVTIRVQLARLTKDNLLELPRLDANDLPTDRKAEPAAWTLMAAPGM